MSQNWHGHWTETTFAPKRLRNWEVPKWYPSWPDRHCITTKFITNDRGHILDSTKKAKHSPWETYKINNTCIYNNNNKCYGKTTWDLPRKITRSVARELSETPEYKKNLWKLHRKMHQNFCKKMQQARKKKKKVDPDSANKNQENKPQEPSICTEKNEKDVRKAMST